MTTGRPQTFAITDQSALAALVVLLGHLLLMTMPLHDAGPLHVGGHGDRSVAVRGAVRVAEPSGLAAAWAGAPAGEAAPDCALEPAPPPRPLPAAPALGWLLALPPGLLPTGGAGLPRPAPWPDPPRPGDPQALLQVFRC